MALSGATNRRKQLTVDTLLIPVAGSNKIYPGGMVCSNTEGYAVAAADSSGYVFEGIAEHAADAEGNKILTEDNVIDNSDGSDGDLYVVVRRTGRFRFDAHETVDQSVMSAQAYVYDDDTVAFDTDNITNNVECGRVARFIDSGTVEVEIEEAVEETGRSFTIPTPTPTPSQV